MAISKKEVEHIAQLARLELTGEDKVLYTEQLSQILDHISKISELKLDEVEPTSHALEIINVFRPDKVTRSFTQEEALSNAPKREDDSFVIPPIV